MINVKNLEFSYSKKHLKVLNDITFKVNKGEVFGLLGPSGAGKSTLQKILLGLLKGFEGDVFVDSHNIKNINKNYYDKIGVGFELPNLYEQLSIYDNLNTFSKLYSNPANINELLYKVSLYEHKDKKVNEISKGMKMRLNFCRALIGSPHILFLDEPTSGLDPNNVSVIQKMMLEEKAKGKTIILTTHNMNFAEHICDRVAFIVDGRIKEIGTPKELKQKYDERKMVVEVKDKTYEFHMNSLSQNNEFLSLLSENIDNMEIKQRTLEEIFTIVTGRVLI